jgi:hypothetical protein
LLFSMNSNGCALGSGVPSSGDHDVSIAETELKVKVQYIKKCDTIYCLKSIIFWDMAPRTSNFVDTCLRKVYRVVTVVY